MNKEFEKIIEKLEKELKLADEEKLRCARENPMQFDSAKGYANGVANSIEIVKQEAGQYNNGWIPCSERLPKYGEVVMCSCTNSGITISCITHKGVKPSQSVRFGQHSVIAWQPLPKPFQKGDNNENS